MIRRCAGIAETTGTCISSARAAVGAGSGGYNGAEGMRRRRSDARSRIRRRRSSARLRRRMSLIGIGNAVTMLPRPRCRERCIAHDPARHVRRLGAVFGHGPPPTRSFLSKSGAGCFYRQSIRGSPPRSSLAPAMARLKMTTQEPRCHVGGFADTLILVSRPV
jgi:hypothetical protein